MPPIPIGCCGCRTLVVVAVHMGYKELVLVRVACMGLVLEQVALEQQLGQQQQQQKQHPVKIVTIKRKKMRAAVARASIMALNSLLIISGASMSISSWLGSWLM